MVDKITTIRVTVGTPLKEVERRLILATLDSHDGNKTHAARTLGIALRTLYTKLDQYGKAA